MPFILVTGAFGNVGQSVLFALKQFGIKTRAFDFPSKKNRKIAKRFSFASELFWGDIRDRNAVRTSLENIDAVIHLAAIIPPESERSPTLAYQVNVEGTKNIISAITDSSLHPRLVFSSSVATYGDRVKNFYISVGDPLLPCEDDEYAKQKVICESLIRASNLDWVICRLSYIVWCKKLTMNPLMYRMPLETHLEVCHTSDTGLALVKAALIDEALGKTFNIAGGEKCRITYHDYLDRMVRLFGLGGIRHIPKEAFSSKGYHCGFMDTDESQRLFHFQLHTLEDYFREVASEASRFKFWAWLFRPLVIAGLLAKSPYLKACHTKERFLKTGMIRG